MSEPLAVLDVGMVSSLSDSAEGTAALMRCGYNNIEPTEFYIAYSEDAYLGAKALLPDDKIDQRNEQRLVTLCKTALDDALKGQAVDLATTPLIFCFAHADDNPPLLNDALENHFLTNLQQTLGWQSDVDTPLSSTFVFLGRVGLVNALAKAREHLYQQNAEQVLILMVDSLFNPYRIDRYEHWHELYRLFTSENSNGFIPGEAAVALRVGKPSAGVEQTCITGIGFGEEPAFIGSGEVLKAKGLSNAIQAACNDAGLQVCDTDFRIASTNGEEYWFREASLAQSRTLEQKKENHDLWHTADGIGEVGAAAGGAMVVMGHFAFKKAYAPGNRALCHISNDDTQRAAFILERSKV